MDKQILTLGYELVPTKYLPQLGYSRLRTIISGHPSQRYFDVKQVSLPTFDGRNYHQTRITRHELASKETFQVCLGRLSLANYQGEELHGFSFGGAVQTAVVAEGLYCDFTSNAPIFMLQDNPVTVSGVLVDEIIDLLAEKEARLARHEDELYSRLSKFEPYTVFLACLVTLRKRLESLPAQLRGENFRKTNSVVQKVIRIVQSTDGWDGHADTLDDLLVGEV
jgi:hypothetical protein